MIMLKQKAKILFRICRKLINKLMNVSRSNVRVLKILGSSKENNSDGKNIKKILLLSIKPNLKEEIISRIFHIWLNRLRMIVRGNNFKKKWKDSTSSHTLAQKKLMNWF